MKAKFCVLIFALAVPWALAQTNLTELLQQGMFEEQANHNINAAITDYQALSTQFETDRQLAATAIFRLGECYREEGLTNQATVEYRRILNEFPDQKTLATLSQEDLAGMAGGSLVAGFGITPANNNSSPDIWNKLKSLRKQELEKVLPTLVPDPVLISLLQQRNAAEATLAQKRTYLSENNPEVTAQKAVLDTVGLQISQRISGIMEALKLQNEAIQPVETADSETSVPPNDEDQEIARLKEMIQNSPDLINAAGDEKRTPLGNAAAKGQLKVAAFLLDHGADVNRTTRGGSPLYLAADAAQRTMVQFLLDHGAEVNADGGAALEVAVEHDYQAVVEALLKAHADIDGRNNIGQTPLMLAARAGNTNLIHSLLAGGANPNLADNNGVTPLSSATLINFPLDLAALKLLLAANAHPNGGGCDSPLLCAINNRNIKSATLLLEAGADPNLKSRVSANLVNVNVRETSIREEVSATPLSAAVSLGEAPMVRLLLKHKADPDDSQINNTPLIFSTVDKTNILQALLNAGADPNVTNDNGLTPLFFAGYGPSDTVRILLAARADPNGGTLAAPLLSAIDKENLTSAKLLLQAGANPNLEGLMRCTKGSYGSRWYDEYSAILRKATPLWLAIQNHQLPMVQLLLKYKANPDAQTSEPPPVIFWALSDTNILQALLDGGANSNVRYGNIGTPLKIAEDWESGIVYEGGYNFPPTDQQRKCGASIAKLLRQHGALEVPPDWDSITVSNLSGKNSMPVFIKGTNNWNQFTLFEFLYGAWDRTHVLRFSDFANITIVRPNPAGGESNRISVNLLNSTNGVDCSTDKLLEFGDVVEIREREHTLAENDTQTDKLIAEMAWCSKDKAGTAKLIVDGGQTIQIPLKDFEPLDPCIHFVLAGTMARNVLTSDSDLSRVKVTRGHNTWIVNCSSQIYDYSDLWLRDGDVVEVPEAR